MGRTIRFGYGSSKNVTFHGYVETDIEPEDWAEMSMAEQEAVELEILTDLVELWVEGDVD